jgi:iron(III) transport system permease protein
MRSRWFAQSLTILLLLVLGTTLFAPIVSVVWRGFQVEGKFSLELFKFVLTDDLSYVPGLVNTVWLASFVTLACLIISIPLAMLAENFRFAGKRWWLALIQVPMVLPPFVGAIGMKKLLSRNGGINALLSWMGLIDPSAPIDWLAHPFWACVLLEALYLYPIAFLNIQASLANIDPALDEAGQNLGAGAWRRFWRITLPLMRPGVFAGATIVFVWSFTELGTPLMVGYRDVTAVQVFEQLQTQNPYDDVYALVTVLMAASILFYVIGKLVLGRPTGAMMAKATVAAEPRKVGWKGTLLVTLPFAVVFIMAVLPHISVVLSSVSRTGMLDVRPSNLTIEHHLEAIRHPIAGHSVVNSFKYSIAATAIDLVLAFAIAYIVVRAKSWGSSLLDTLSMLPLAIPGLVLAFGFFAITQGDSVVGFLDPIRHDPTPLLIIAYAVRRMPFLVRSCAAGLEQTSEALEEAAVNLGASGPRTLWKVTIPLLTANFIAGGLLVFSRSMLEVSDSLILAFDQRTYPMTKAILDISDLPDAGPEIASALGVWGMILLTVTIAGASLALGKRLGALFRV